MIEQTNRQIVYPMLDAFGRLGIRNVLCSSALFVKGINELIDLNRSVFCRNRNNL